MTCRVAAPRLESGKVVIPEEARQAREESMVKRLPQEGLALVVLGGGHDLARVLGPDTLYVRVEVPAVRAACGR